LKLFKKVYTNWSHQKCTSTSNAKAPVLRAELITTHRAGRHRQFLSTTLTMPLVSQTLHYIWTKVGTVPRGSNLFKWLNMRKELLLLLAK